MLDDSGELVSDPKCNNPANLPTPTPSFDSSSDGLVTRVATAVGALVVVIIVVVVLVMAIAYMMMRKRKFLQEKQIFEGADSLRRYVLYVFGRFFIFHIATLFYWCSR